MSGRAQADLIAYRASVDDRTSSRNHKTMLPHCFVAEECIYSELYADHTHEDAGDDVSSCYPDSEDNDISPLNIQGSSVTSGEGNANPRQMVIPESNGQQWEAKRIIGEAKEGKGKPLTETPTTSVLSKQAQKDGRHSVYEVPRTEFETIPGTAGTLVDRHYLEDSDNGLARTRDTSVTFAQTSNTLQLQKTGGESTETEPGSLRYRLNMNLLEKEVKSSSKQEPLGAGQKSVNFRQLVLAHNRMNSGTRPDSSYCHSREDCGISLPRTQGTLVSSEQGDEDDRPARRQLESRRQPTVDDSSLNDNTTRTREDRKLTYARLLLKARTDREQMRQSVNDETSISAYEVEYDMFEAKVEAAWNRLRD